MGFFDMFSHRDINSGVEEFLSRPGALLLDVRSPSEYAAGHIPGSYNLPLSAIDKAVQVVENKDTALYVYCQSGARSRQAARALESMGYSNIKDLGGISAWRGKVEH